MEFTQKTVSFVAESARRQAFCTTVMRWRSSARAFSMRVFDAPSGLRLREHLEHERGVRGQQMHRVTRHHADASHVVRHV